MNTQLQQRLAELRTRTVWAGTGSAIAWGLLCAVVVLLAAMWLDLVIELSPAIRMISGLAALVGAAVLLVRVLRVAMRGANPSAIADRLDAAGSARGEIVSGIDLALHPASGGAAMTAGLSAIAVNRAAQMVADIPASAVVSLRQLKKPAVILLVIAVLMGIAAIAAPRMAATQWLRFVDPFGDHPPYSSLMFSIDPGNTRVVYGSAVDVNVTLDGGTADRVDLVLVDREGHRESVPMFPEPGAAWRASVANVTAPCEYFVTAGRARSVRYQLGVITVPRIEAVAFRVTWPAYTNRPPYEGPLPQGGLVGLPGTTVRVRAKSNRSLSGGTMAFAPAATPTTLPMTQPSTIAMSPAPGSSNEVEATFEINSPGKLTVGVTDTEQQESTESFTASVGVLKDERPFVRLTEPKPNSFATPDITMQLVAAAEDDFGISKLSIYRGLNDTRPRPMEIAVPANHPTQVQGSLSLPLSEYGLRPGDVVKLFARVEDNDPAGAKGAESTVVTIHIVSQQDMDRMMLAKEGLEAMESKYAQAARRMEAMADRIEKLKNEIAKLDPDSELAEAKHEELQKLADDLETAAGEIEKTAEHTLPLDLDKALTKELTKAADALRDAAREVREANKSGLGAGRAGEKLADAAKALGREQQDFKQNASDPLEHLDQIFPLIEDQGRFINLTAQQKDLAERISALETLNGHDDPQLKARMRDLQEQQSQVRNDLRQLLDDIEEHAERLPEDPKLDDLRKTARDFVEAVRKSDAQMQIQQAEEALSDFAGTRAAMAARQAAETLEKFIAKCQSMGQQGEVCLKFQPKLASDLGDTVEQLLGASGLPGVGKTGQGMGGYSARRSSLKNVGLYGRTPVRGKESAAQSGQGKADKGIGTRSDGQADANSNPDGSASNGVTQANGEGDAAVPQQYKKRVNDYFRRVADELEQ